MCACPQPISGCDDVNNEHCYEIIYSYHKEHSKQFAVALLSSSIIVIWMDVSLILHRRCHCHCSWCIFPQYMWNFVSSSCSLSSSLSHGQQWMIVILSFGAQRLQSCIYAIYCLLMRTIASSNSLLYLLQHSQFTYKQLQNIRLFTGR